MKYLNKLTLLITIIFISGCFSNPITRYNGICSLMDDKISWYRAVIAAEKKHQVRASLILAFIKQESSFNSKARPPQKKLFDFIPLGGSSAYGFSQAKDETWKWYKQKTNNTDAKRTSFADSSDFIGWYVNQSNKMTNIKKNDVVNQYLAYHEGHNGFKRKTYNKKPWLIDVAKKVKNTANNYRAELATCREKLNNTYSWSLL